MKLKEKIKADLIVSMKERNAEKSSVIRMLIAGIDNKEISLRKDGEGELTDDQVSEVVGSEVKKRKDSIEAFEQGDREDLAEKEKSEIKFLEKYLPEQLSEEEVEKIVKEVIDSMGEVSQADFGKVMGQVMGRLKGKADGNMVQIAVKKLLL
jgi:uncharacterized protein YqeY